MTEAQERPIIIRAVERGTTDSYLTVVGVEDIPAILDLAKKAYPEKVLPGVIKSLSFYKDCLQAGIDDGRKFFKREENGQIVGVCGVQKKAEDPSSVCWGSWFFIDPEKRNSMLTYRMGVAFANTVKEFGYKTMYAETSNDHTEYYNIAPYLVRFGFTLSASIPNFYETGVDMQVYVLELK
mgnify:CR=1 FL=1